MQLARTMNELVTKFGEMIDMLTNNICDIYLHINRMALLH